MKASARVLLVEDSDDDAELILRELEKSGASMTHHRVQTAEDMRDALTGSAWDIILSDYSMPEFDGLSALRLVQSMGLDIPLIILSGTIEEEAAVEALRGGARDFIVKGRLARLVPAVEREMSQAMQRRNRRAAERETARALDAKLRAEAANDAKTSFLAAMSHELRTPLNAILGFTEILYGGHIERDSPQYTECLGDILSSAHHLMRVINDVLDLSKVEAGKLEFWPQDVILADVISNAVGSLRTLAADKRIEIRVDVDPSVEVVTLDPGRLKQVLYNYLSNALKFTPEAGGITVRTGPHGPDMFTLEVEDTGIGIDPADVGRLFGDYEQLGVAMTIGQVGTGLGLALTRRLVEAQGGSVGLRSTPGVGSVFIAHLPRNVPAIV